MLAGGEVIRFLQLRQEMSETKMLRAFRRWVCDQETQGWPTAPSRSRPRRNK